MATSVKSNRTTLTSTQIDFYDDFGYLIVPNVYDVRDCQTVIQAADEFADDDFSVCLNIHRKSFFFMDIARDHVLVEMAKSVQRHDIVGLNDQYLYKKPGTKYAKQAWVPHQDSVMAGTKQGTYVQLHIFLEDHNKNNGGIYFYPGSHRLGHLSYDYKLSSKEESDYDGQTRPGWECQVPEGYERRDVVATAGSVCLQHGNIIHGSYPNQTVDQARCQYTVAYLNKGASFNPGRSSRKVPVAV